MIEWLGIEHLFELSTTEVVLGFFTPLAIFAAFAVAQIILPGRSVPGYVINPETGKPRNYRLNGLLVFAIALLVWGFAFEPMGIPRDWFYRTSIFAVIGGTVFTLILAIPAVFSQPVGAVKNPLLALWFGRAQEISFFNERFDVKMYFYVVGGTMLSLNALSGAVWHYEQFGADSNPGVFMYAAFFTFYVMDYFIFRARPAIHVRPDPREDGLHVVLGRAGDLRVGVHPAAVGHGRAPEPRILGGVDECVVGRDGCVVPDGVDDLARREPAEVLVQAVPRPQVPWDHRARVHPGRRPQDPVQRNVGRGKTLQLHGRGFPFLFDRHGVRPLREPVGVDILSSLSSLFSRFANAATTRNARRSTARRSGRSTRRVCRTGYFRGFIDGVGPRVPSQTPRSYDELNEGARLRQTHYLRNRRLNSAPTCATSQSGKGFLWMRRRCRLLRNAAGLMDNGERASTVGNSLDRPVWDVGPRKRQCNSTVHWKYLRPLMRRCGSDGFP